MSKLDIAIPKVPFPEKLAFLFEPYPYKIMYGGRGASKSWSTARAFVLLGMKKRERFLCLREVQHSIKDSVHQLLVDQIEELGLKHFYRVTDKTIRGANGTTFAFMGIQDHTSNSTRSFEGATKVWVEEAQTISRESWKVLIPTIRTEGREFWVCFNPQLETSDTYQRFVVHPPKGAYVCKINWSDNPWFPKVLEEERLHAKATMEPEEYQNVWEGDPIRSVPGSIYARQMAQMYAENRVTLVPYDHRLKVHVVQDLGWSDAMSVGFFQRRISEVRCIRAFEFPHFKSSEMAAEVRKFPYNYGAVWLPHDGFSEGRHGATDAETYRSFGFVVRRVPDASKEAGIRACKEVLGVIWMHEPDTKGLREALNRYRRGKSTSGVIGQPMHDEASNYADMMRYMALSCRMFYNEDNEHWSPPMEAFQETDPYLGVLGG